MTNRCTTVIICIFTQSSYWSGDILYETSIYNIIAINNFTQSFLGWELLWMQCL